MSIPWQQLLLALAVCLLCSALGFRRIVYFVSLGYAVSIAAQRFVRRRALGVDGPRRSS
jgi:hypothetical protein